MPLLSYTLLLSLGQLKLGLLLLAKLLDQPKPGLPVVGLRKQGQLQSLMLLVNLLLALIRICMKRWYNYSISIRISN